MDKQQRQQISAQYFELFGGVDDDTLAERLGVTSKTIGRLRGSANVPNLGVSEMMKGQIDDILDYAAMSDQERIDAQEQARARREEHQRKIPIDVIEDGITRRYPPWMKRALERFQNGAPDVTVDLLVDRLEVDVIDAVEADIRPFALNLLASAYHETGRIVETIETLDRALAQTQDNGRFAVLQRVILSNLAGAHVRRKDFDSALRCVKRALAMSPSHAPAYYHAVHAANAQRDSAQLIFWLGRALQAATTSMKPQDIDKFITRAQTDPDLGWARGQDIWQDFERDMLDLRRSMMAQLGNAG